MRGFNGLRLFILWVVGQPVPERGAPGPVKV